MTDKEKIRKEIVRMHNLLPVMDDYNIYVNYADRICTTLEMYIDSLQEEPVSNDLEQAAVEAFKHIVDSDKNNFYEIFKAGAQWQKEQLMKDAVYGLVCGHDESSPAWIDLNLLNKPNIKVGTEVKLIIIKDE